MNRQSLALLIPILALAIGLAAVILNALVKFHKVRGEQSRSIADDEVKVLRYLFTSSKT